MNLAMKSPIKSLIGLLVLVLGSLSLHAQVPTRPSPERLYNNLSREFPDFLTQQEAQAIEQKLEDFSNETSNQICVVIVDDLNGYDANGFATELGQEWGVGKANKNNGVVILIKPTKTDGGRDLAIAVGYGLEGAIPDLATKRIREDEMQPRLKQGDYYGAIDAGVDLIMKLAKSEISVKDYTRKKEKGSGLLAAVIIIIVVIVLLRNMFGGGKGGRTMSGIGEAFFWGSMMNNSFGRGRSSGWGSGGSSWGGGGGGGWGGFGGGSFGGGGSSGKW